MRKPPDEEIIETHNRGLTSVQISVELECALGYVDKRKRALGLRHPPKIGYRKR